MAGPDVWPTHLKTANLQKAGKNRVAALGTGSCETDPDPGKHTESRFGVLAACVFGCLPLPPPKRQENVLNLEKELGMTGLDSPKELSGKNSGAKNRE